MTLASFDWKTHMRTCVCKWPICFPLTYKLQNNGVLLFAELPFKEVSRKFTPCAWALVPDAPEVLMIGDLTQDARLLSATAADVFDAVHFSILPITSL